MHGYLQFYKMVVKTEEGAYRALQWKAAGYVSEKTTLALLARADNARDPIRKAKITEAQTNAKIARLKAKILEKVDGLIDRGEMQEALALLQMQPKQIEKTGAE